LASIPIRVDPSNSFMDGSAIGSFLPVLNISVAAFRTVLQHGQLQPLIPAMPEEGASPVRALLLARILLLVPPARLFIGSALLLLIAPFLITLFLNLALPLVEEDARCHPGFGSR
jgi:Na+-transporting NADH:ubiquinone oxidoreductase subunit NqrD